MIKRVLGILTRGILRENPIIGLVLGLCPVLAVSTSLQNALGMGVAVLFVLTCSNVIISLIKGAVPSKIRIPVYIVVIATFVTIVELFMAAYLEDLHKQLGIFVPLIVVNCIVLGRAEAFASKNSPVDSFFDGIGMGIGFTLVLALIGLVREVLGAGTVWGFPIAKGIDPVRVFALPPGALIVIGIIMAIAQAARRNK